MITQSTPGRRPGKGLVAVVAAGLLLAACGSDGGGGGGKTPPPPVEPSTRSFEEAKEATVETWEACEMFADHVTELAEFLEYKKFDDELFSSNGQNTAGVRICEGHAVFHEDPEHASNNVETLIQIGFGTASLVGHRYHEEKYKTPTGRYDLMIQNMLDIYDPATLAERTVDGPWEEATVLLGDSGTGTTLSGFIVDTERDFMLRLSLSGFDPKRDADKLTWTLEEAAKHFQEVTMVESYQAMVDRYDKAH